MKRWLLGILLCAFIVIGTACTPAEKQPNIVATTMPVYTFTQALCEGTPLQVGQLVLENISCLHDYTLTVRHMKLLENAELLIVSGAGLEDFLVGAIPDDKIIIDTSKNIQLHCSENDHAHSHGHSHETDPHYWLSIENAKQMAHTVCEELKVNFPQYAEQFDQNLTNLKNAFSQLQNYADTNLSALENRQIITFHDGFSYMAEAFDLTILKAIEEESGSEASAKELMEICDLVTEHSLSAIFIEKNGSSSAASVISNETGADVFALDMAIAGSNYFEAMRYNIDTLKEALG